MAEISALFLAMKPSPAALMWLGCEAAADRYGLRDGLGVTLPASVRQGWRWRLRIVMAWAYAAARAQRDGTSEQRRADAEEALHAALERFADFHARHVLPFVPDHAATLRDPPPLPLPLPVEESGSVIALPVLNPRSAHA